MLAVPAYLGLVVALYVLMLAVMYWLWRDVCGLCDKNAIEAEALTA